MSRQRPNRFGAKAKQAGFTLIELMVAMVVSAIVVLGVYAFSTIQQSTAGLHERNVRVQQALEGAMWTMAQDVRMAGLGFARSCSELRIYDQASGRLINPGGVPDPTNAYVDQVTEQSYWVLRDGIQANWDSSIGGTLPGQFATSAHPSSQADSFDVVLSEANYTDSYGVFQLAAEVDPADGYLVMEGSPLLDNSNAAHLAQVQQLFVPGSFIALARTPVVTANPFRPEIHGQCPLMQVTGDVQADPGDSQRWRIPIDGGVSGFNADLTMLLDRSAAQPDWDPAIDAVVGASVMALGRLRWSRYEVDYTVENTPYLVRRDIIGFRAGIDPENLGAVDYPHCQAGECPAPQLHLPVPLDNGSAPPTVAVGPMIEDMQVAVGCDGYTDLAAGDASLPVPDAGFAEVGPSAGANAGLANFQIDENASGNQRDRDEWVGNARQEQWAPDCVFYGTGQENAAGWVTIEGNENPPPDFRMSPQTLRVTLVGSSELEEAAGGLATDQVLAVEDRPPLDSAVGTRQRFTLTEVFTPANLRWRDPTVL